MLNMVTYYIPRNAWLVNTCTRMYVYSTVYGECTYMSMHVSDRVCVRVCVRARVCVCVCACVCVNRHKAESESEFFYASSTFGAHLIVSQYDTIYCMRIHYCTAHIP